MQGLTVVLGCQTTRVGGQPGWVKRDLTVDPNTNFVKVWIEESYQGSPTHAYEEVALLALTCDFNDLTNSATNQLFTNTRWSDACPSVYFRHDTVSSSQGASQHHQSPDVCVANSPEGGRTMFASSLWTALLFHPFTPTTAFLWMRKRMSPPTQPSRL